MSGNRLWNLTKKPDKAWVTLDKADKSDMFGLGLNMSRLGLWNLAKKPDKAKRPNMSEMGARHVRVRSLKPK
jgi:hypothetical protein